MAQSFTIIRAVGTTLTRASSVETLTSVAAAILDLFKAGGTHDAGMNKCYLQWTSTGTTSVLDIIIEDEVLAGLSADLATRASAIRTALLTLSQITSVDVDNIATLEQSSPAHRF